MKTLLAITAAIALASSSAFAYDSSIDAQEFYSGIEGSNLVTAATGTNDNLHSEGNFVSVESSPSIEGISISSSLSDTNLHSEGNFDV